MQSKLNLCWAILTNKAVIANVTFNKGICLPYGQRVYIRNIKFETEEPDAE